MSFNKAMIVGFTLTAINAYLDYLSWGWIRYPIIFFATVIIIGIVSRKNND